MMTSTCPSCGNPVSPAAKFCRTCGYFLQPPLSPPPPVPVAAPVAAASVTPVRHRSRTMLIVAGIVLLVVLFCILSIMVIQKIALMKNATALPEAFLSTQEILGVETEALVAATEPVIKIEVPSLAPEATTNSLPPAGKYDIVVAGGGEHPDGELSYRTPYTCMGGCGSYNGTIELREIRIVDQGFTLDLNIRIQEVSGDPWLFEADLGDMTLEINEQTFVPKASNFPIQVTSPGLMSGYLSFYDEIPLAEDIQYHLVLSISNRLAQPIEGWLAPPTSP